MPINTRINCIRLLFLARTLLIIAMIILFFRIPNGEAQSPLQPSLLTVGSEPIFENVATPTFSTNGGVFASPVALAMQTATAGASIHYTVDGSTPTQLSTSYTGTIAISKSATIRAKAFKAGFNASAEAVASFTIGSVIGGSNLVGYWKFDEGTGTSANDSSGSGNKGTLINGPKWTTGIDGNALYFDGTDDSVTVFASNLLELSNSFTLSAWVNPATAFTDFRSILVKNYRYYLYSSVSGYCGDGSALGGFSELSTNTVCQSMPLPINAWTHLTVTFNGSKLTLYRNGVAVSSSAASATLSPTMGTLQIGASQYGENFHGLIDEVRVYNSALTQTEIEAIYKQTAITLPFNYSIAHSGDRSVNAGSSITNNINLDLLSGISQPVFFSVSGLPSGVTWSLSSASCTPTCSTVITVTTSGATPPGSYPITVTAMAGTLKKASFFTLSVSLALAIVTPATSSATFTGNTYYVATNGSDAYNCTQARTITTPKRNITGTSGGLSCLTAGNGDTLSIRSGTYQETIRSVVSGTSYANAATIRSYPGEMATLDGRIALEGPSYIIFDRLTLLGSSEGAIWIGSTDARVPASHHIKFLNVNATTRDGVVATVNRYGHHVEFIGGAYHDAPINTPNCIAGGGGNACYAFYIEGDDNIIERANIFNNPSYGIHLYSGYSERPDRNIVRYNELYNNTWGSSSAAAILLGSGDNNIAHDNIVRGNKISGIGTGNGATNTRIYNNTVVGNGFAGITWGNQSGAIIKNNILARNGQDFYDYNGTPVNRANNLCAKAGAGCIAVGDPLFKAAELNNFEILLGSPAINNGETLTDIPAYDINGVVRPTGTRWDIGAYEYR